MRNHSNGKAIKKLLSILTKSWKRKVKAIIEAKDLDTLTPNISKYVIVSQTAQNTKQIRYQEL